MMGTTTAAVVGLLASSPLTAEFCHHVLRGTPWRTPLTLLAFFGLAASYSWVFKDELPQPEKEDQPKTA